MTSPDGYGRGSIITPEAVLLDFELAGLSSRSVAYGIDFAVQLLALFAWFAVLGVVAIASELAAIIVLLFGLILIVFGYPVVMETFNNGRTLGRMAVGTRVVTIEGAPVRFRHAFIRALLAVVDLFITAGAVAVTTSLLTRRGQRLGDLVAGTMVIRERTSKLHAGALQFWAPQYLAAWASQVDTRALGSDGYQLVRDFLSRPDLAAESHDRLAVELSGYVSERLPHAARTPQVPARDYLMAIAAASQQVAGTPPPPAPRPASQRTVNVPPPPGARPGSQPPPPGTVRPGSQPPAPGGDRPSDDTALRAPYPAAPPLAGAPAAGMRPAVPQQEPVAPPVPPAPNDGGFSAPG